jgi:hypothetical protein
MDIRNLECCGWRELDGVVNYRGSLEPVVKALSYARVLGTNYFATGGILFTQAGTRNKYGFRLEKDLLAAGLGTVTRLPRFKNHNTGRIIQAFLWIPDKAALIKYATDNNLFIVRRYGYY